MFMVQNRKKEMQIAWISATSELPMQLNIKL